MSSSQRPGAENIKPSQGMSSPTSSDYKPFIKNEEAADESSQAIPSGIDAADDNFDAELEEFIEDEEGSTYYSDAGFRIKQVPEARLRLCGLGELYSMHRLN